MNRKPSPIRRPETAEKKKAGPARFFQLALEGVITLSLAALFFGVPVFCTGLTMQGPAFDKQMYFFAVLLTGLTAWFAKAVAVGELKVRRTPLDTFVFLFLATYAASFFVSVDRWHSFWGPFSDPSRGLLPALSLAVAYFFVFTHATPRRLPWILASLLLSVSVLAVWLVLTVLGIRFLPVRWESLSPLTPFGTLGGSALFLGASLPLFLTALSKVWTEGKRLAIRIAGAAAVLVGMASVLAALVLLWDYVPWPVVLAGLGFFVLYVLARLVRLSGRWSWLALLLWSGLLFVFLAGRGDWVRADLPAEAAPNAKLSWEVARRGLEERFFFGSGPGTYDYAFSRFRPEEFNREKFFTARFPQGSGLLFEAMPTLGAAGTVSLLLLFLSFVGLGLYLLSYDSRFDRLYSLGTWSTALTLAVGALSVPAGGAIVSMAVLCAAFSMATILRESRAKENVWRLSMRPSPRFMLTGIFLTIVAGVGIAYAFVFLGRTVRADLSAGKALRTQALTEAGSVGLLERALAYRDGEGRYYAALAGVYMALANQEAVGPEETRDLEALKRFVEGANRSVLKARERMPNDVSVQELAAQSYESAAALAGTDAKILEQAAGEYARAIELEPNNPLLYVRLGQAKRGLASLKKQDGEREAARKEAEEAFRKAVEKKGDFGLAYFHLGLSDEALADIEGSVANLEKAVRLEPSQAEFRAALARLYRIRGREEDLGLAVTLSEQVLRAREDDMNVWFNLGLTHEKAGRFREAVECYRKVVALLGDADENARAAVRQLEAMIENASVGKSNVERLEAAFREGGPSSENAVGSDASDR
jgi:tetratricopeptide (TPR) repeat protein